jgi:uncharacterized protein YndB with AHSA1/START domain
LSTHITCSTVVDRSAEEVFAYVTDPTRFSEWQKGVVEGHMDTSGTPTVGTRCVTTRKIGFADRVVTAEVSQIDPPRSWGVRGIDGPVRSVVDVTVESLGDSRARVTIVLDFEGRGFGKVLVPLFIRREARREMPTNLAALKERLERPA